jgi:hypothetical protein
LGNDDSLDNIGNRGMVKANLLKFDFRIQLGMIQLYIIEFDSSLYFDNLSTLENSSFFNEIIINFSEISKYLYSKFSMKTKFIQILILLITFFVFINSTH